jgi:hypothetical protein
MAKVITAPEFYNRHFHAGFSIFLAGAIDMGAAVDWQAWVIEQLAPQENLVILNPRRAEFTPATLDEQVLWELNSLEDADAIFMWFPKDAKAPISFFEAGLYWHSGKLIVGAEPGFYRRRNLEITGDHYEVPVYETLDEMLQVLTQRHGG